MTGKVCEDIMGGHFMTAKASRLLLAGDRLGSHRMLTCLCCWVTLHVTNEVKRLNQPKRMAEGRFGTCFVLPAHH